MLLGETYFPPSAIHGFTPLLLKIENFHMRPAGTITPAVCTNDSIDAFADCMTAPGILRSISTGVNCLFTDGVITIGATMTPALLSWNDSSTRTRKSRMILVLRLRLVLQFINWNFIFYKRWLWVSDYWASTMWVVRLKLPLAVYIIHTSTMICF